MGRHHRRNYTRKSKTRKKTLDQKLRNKNKKKISVLNRTVLSNAAQLDRLKHDVETNVLENVQCTFANRFGGQWFSEEVSQAGINQSSENVVIRPWSGMGPGSNPNQRQGRQVIMKSLTYRIDVTVEGGVVASNWNRVGCYIVLDTQPMSTPFTSPQADQPTLNANGGASIGNTIQAQLLTGQSIQPHLQFQNMVACGGPGARFKVLGHLKGRIQQVAAGSTARPSITWEGTLTQPYKIKYGDYRDDATLAENPTNQQLLFFPYSDSAAAPHPTFTGYMRFRYREL